MSKIRQVDVSKLKRGMYVVDTMRGQVLAPPVYSVEGFILSSTEGIELHKRGFTCAFINEARSVILPDADVEVVVDPCVALDSPEVPLISHTSSYQDEVRKAQELHVQALAAARHMHDTLEAGLSESAIQSIHGVIKGTIESLKRNENALLSIARLRNADEYTFTHSVNVAMYAVVLGRRLRVAEDSLEDLALAGFFHDIGKILVPPDVLNYPGKLSADKLESMKAHAELGRMFLEHYPGVPAIARTGAMDHHERSDGSGYPLRKKTDEISLVGRILAVVDVYDALTSKRCYKNAITPAKSLSIMYQNKERDFSPGFMEAFIEAMGVYPVGSLVRLSNNYLGVVVEQNSGAALKPNVVTLIDAFGDKISYPKLLSLEVHSSISILEPVLSLPVSIDLEQAVLYAK